MKKSEKIWLVVFIFFCCALFGWSDQMLYREQALCAVMMLVSGVGFVRSGAKKNG